MTFLVLFKMANERLSLANKSIGEVTIENNPGYPPQN